MRVNTQAAASSGTINQIPAGIYGVELMLIEPDGPSPDPRYAKNGPRFKWHFTVRKAITGDEAAEGLELPWQWTTRKLSPPGEFQASNFYKWATALLGTSDFEAANFEDTRQLHGLKAIATVQVSNSGRSFISDLTPTKEAQKNHVRLAPCGEPDEPEPVPGAVMTPPDDDDDELF